jgi:hypothetical protein
MNLKHASLILALAAVASTSAFAEGGMVYSSGGSSVSSGTGVLVGQGAPSSSVTVIPSSSVAVTTVPGNRLLPGAATVQANSTTVMGGPAAGGISGSQTVTTTYWVNVPGGVQYRSDFQRWQSLKP